LQIILTLLNKVKVTLLAVWSFYDCAHAENCYSTTTARGIEIRTCHDQGWGQLQWPNYIYSLNYSDFGILDQLQ